VTDWLTEKLHHVIKKCT